MPPCRAVVGRSALGMVLALWLAGAPPLAADVFWRFKSRGGSDSLRQLGGNSLYTTETSINGEPGRLAVFGFDSPAREVGRSLCALWRIPSPGAREGTMITHAEKGMAHLVMLLPSVQGGGCVALLFSQTINSAVQVRSTSTPPWPATLPDLGVAPQFTAACTSTRTLMVDAHTSASREHAMRAARERFKAEGWQETLPVPLPDFAILTQDGKQCLVFARNDPKSGGARITLLQREGATP